MKKKIVFGSLCLMLMCLCACKTGNEEVTTSEEMTTNEETTIYEDVTTNDEELLDVNQYESVEGIISIEKLDLEKILSEGVEVSTYKVKYQVDDCTVVSYLSVPNACIEEQVAYPCIIFNRGGNREFSANKPEDIAYMAESSGKVIFATQYRGVDGGTGTEEFGGADLNDVLKLVDFCEEFAFVDTEQIYMMGISRGGMMTYMAAREDSRIKKAIVISGVADAFMGYDERIDMQQVYKELVGETPESNPEEYTKRSATYWADEIKCPILIIHSKFDKKVSFEQAEKMTKALEEADKEYKFISYEDDVHGLHPEDFSIIMEWCQ